MKTVAIALSGGIDSALSAYLLKKEGFHVIGLHADFGYSSEPSLPWIKKITSFLKIPLEVLYLKEVFQQKVVNYFISEYKNGRTPNPCVVCNPLIKFDWLYQKGLDLGADYFATGHYARIVPAPWGKGQTIARGLDIIKDQSYFLHRVRPQNLNHILFPLGSWTKDKVRGLAREIGLPINPGGESQDICFLPKGGYREFLLRHNPPNLIRSGDIVDLQGKKLGTHQGLFAYTIGQRRGLGLPAKEPYYVVRMDPGLNRLVIGGKKDLESSGCYLSDVCFLSSPPEIDGLEIMVQVRYKHQAAKARLRLGEDQRLEIHFQNPQKAVTPGQAAVLYWEDRVLGGGWIEESWKK
ncbi:MAG: tRNA 2-thiouridine(34) synthase MnmA [Deltaproteobacteria bacterium]|nr:tRNA 2-thiouridine(34) synthase MnmA [Deltaproteobacteria bacterium]